MSISASREPAGRPPRARHPAFARAHSLLSHFSQLDVLMLGIWVISTTMPFGWAQPLRYIAAFYFLASMVLFARQTTPTMFRAWPTFILPVLCVVSAVWAPVASEAIRKGMLMALTAIAAIYAASRLSGRQVLTIFLFCEGIAGLMSLVMPNPVDGAWTGIFGQKNFLSGNMAVLHVCALGVALDRGSNRLIRLGAAGLVPIAMLIIVMAKSATITMLMGVSTVALLGHAMFWAPASRVRHMRTLLVMAFSILLVAAALLVFGILRLDATESVLGAFGKDSTLTGRTYLWSIAERILAEKPMTGMGAEGFWRAERGAANSITQYFFYDKYTRFSFHNSYLENGVALGYPGYWATVVLAVWAIWRTGMNWIRNQSMVNAAFLMLAIMIVVRSNAEIDLAQEFMATAFLLFIGAARKEKLVKAPIIRQAAPMPPPHAAQRATP